MWQRDTFPSAEAATQAAQEAGAGTAGVHFAVELAADGWFWFPRPGCPVQSMARVSRAAEAEAQALQGRIPAPPRISTETKAYTYAKATIRLHEAAVRGDKDAVRTCRIFGVSTHALLVRRYQRALLVAINLGAKA